MNKYSRIFILTISISTIFAISQVNAQEIIFVYNRDNNTSPQLIEKFETETGIRVILHTYKNHQKLLERIRAGDGYDVIVVPHNLIPSMISEELLLPINVTQLGGYENIKKRWQNPIWDPFLIYSLPWQWGTTSLSVNTEIYKQKVNTYHPFFFPPPQIRNKISISQNKNEVIALTLVYLGQPLCTEDLTNISKVYRLLREQKDFLAYENQTNLSIEMSRSGETLIERLKNPAIKYIYPKEGVILWMENLAIPLAANNPASALKFIQFMMKPQNIAMQTNFSGYNNSIKGSRRYFLKVFRNAPEINPPRNIKAIMPMACSAKTYTLYDTIWEDLYPNQ